jgi:hypothetical protein
VFVHFQETNIDEAIALGIQGANIMFIANTSPMVLNDEGYFNQCFLFHR